MTIPERPIPESYWVVPGQFLAGGYAGSRDEAQSHQRLTAFLNAGFDTFFDLTLEGELPSYLPILMEEAGYYNRSIHYHRFPIPDRGLPSSETLIAILEAIDAATVKGCKVYLHCWGGIGRTGTIVACYLVHQGLDGKAALHRLNELYQTCAQYTSFPYSPETEEQAAFVVNWRPPSPLPLSSRSTPEGGRERGEG
ncbi:MAG: dual specificity protein phosphatase family protein [Chloroflexi bacterium]|nr:dual specificity protein phosphatase family protein [Chloroflexota bacterium]